ncbi:MAG: AAA family ATPase [Rhodoferax sp.]
MASLITDNPPLMAAIYADLLHGDQTLYESALAHHKTYDLTLVAGLDIPWRGDRQHDAASPSREAIDAQLRATLARGQIAYTVVYGLGPARVEAALNAIAPLRHDRVKPDSSGEGNWQWSCEKCSDPECEHRMFTGLLKIGNK